MTKIIGAMLFLFTATNAFAQDMPFLSAEQGNPFVVYGDLSATGSIADSRFGLNIPVYTSGNDSVFATVRSQRVQLNERTFLPDRQFEVPQDFGSLEAGAGWLRRAADDTMIGFSAQVGASGRQLFDAQSKHSISATYFSEYKFENGHSLILLVNYANNRTILNNLPIPAVAWLIKKPDVTYALGLPFAFVNWRPMPFMVTSFLSPFGGSLEGAMFVMGPLQAFASFSWSPKAFQNLAPDGSDDRLFFERKDWILGLRMPLKRGTFISIAYDYIFDERIALGRSLTDLHSDSQWLTETGGVQLKVRASF